jgi:hypothetical protein
MPPAGTVQELGIAVRASTPAKADREYIEGDPDTSYIVTAHPLMWGRHVAARTALDMITDDSIHRIRESRHAPQSVQG